MCLGALPQAFRTAGSCRVRGYGGGTRGLHRGRFHVQEMSYTGRDGSGLMLGVPVIGAMRLRQIVCISVYSHASCDG